MLPKVLPGFIPYWRPITIRGGHRFMRIGGHGARAWWDPEVPGLIELSGRSAAPILSREDARLDEAIEHAFLSTKYYRCSGHNGHSDDVATRQTVGLTLQWKAF